MSCWVDCIIYLDFVNARVWSVGCIPTSRIIPGSLVECSGDIIGGWNIDERFIQEDKTRGVTMTQRGPILHHNSIYYCMFDKVYCTQFLVDVKLNFGNVIVVAICEQEE